MSTSTQQASLGHDVGLYLRHQLRGRRGLIAAALLLILAALWFGWPALVAAGIAPLIIAFAPCAVMCGLGLCMKRACKRSEGSEASSAGAPGSSVVAVDEPSATEATGYTRFPETQAKVDVASGSSR